MAARRKPEYNQAGDRTLAYLLTKQTTIVLNNWLYLQARDYLRWSGSIYKKMVTIAPVYTLSVVLASLVAQVSLLLAFFLPIKIVLLIGSPGIPRYFPERLLEMGRDRLALFLGLSAAGVYVLYLLTSRITEICSERGAEVLLARSRKLVLFANQEGIAKQAYQRFSSSVAALLFAALGLLVIMFLNQPLAGFLVLLLLVVVVVFSAIVQVHPAARDWIAENVSGIMETLAAAFYLSAFAYIVVELISGGEFRILAAIISLLLARQIAQRLSGSLKDVIVLTSQKPQVNALFFHGKALVESQTVQTRSFWSLLQKQRREVWLRDMLQEITQGPLQILRTYWHQLDARGVAGLDVTTVRRDSDETNEFFVKLFDARHRAQAIHEATLLGEGWTHALPAPVLITTTTVAEYQCLVFEAVPDQRISHEQQGKWVHQLLYRSWFTEPPETVVNRYRRSKPFLVDRLNYDVLSRLHIAFNTPEEQTNLDRFNTSLQHILEILSNLPLFVYNPRININNINVDVHGNAVVTHWGAWSLEPVGAGWPILEPQLETLGHFIDFARVRSRHLSEVQAMDARLAALMFAFDIQCSLENYLSAIQMLPEILNCVDARVAEGKTGGNIKTARI